MRKNNLSFIKIALMLFILSFTMSTETYSTSLCPGNYYVSTSGAWVNGTYVIITTCDHGGTEACPNLGCEPGEI